MSFSKAEGSAEKLSARYYCISALLIYVFLSFFSFRLIFSDGCVATNDLAPLYKFEQLFRPFEFPWDSLSGLGTAQFAVDNIVYNVPWILWSTVTGSAVLSYKLFFCINLALAGFGFFLVFPRLTQLMSKVGAFVAGLSYMFNPWVLDRIIYGHNTIILGYAILPYALFFYVEALQKVDVKHILICGMLSSLLLLAKVHMAYFFFILIFFHSLFYVLIGVKKAFRQRLIKQLFVVISIFALTIAVSFPILYHMAKVNIPLYVVREEETAYYAVNFSSLTLWDLLYVFLGVSLILWAIKALKKESHIPYYSPFVLCLFCLCVLGIILANGSVWPTTSLYAFLFNYLPGFFIFTEANRFLFFPVVAIAFFLGCFVDRSFVYNRTLFPANSIGFFLKQVKRLFAPNLPVLVLLILMFSSTWQFFTGDVNGKLKPTSIPSYYEELDTWLRTQEGDFRVAFMPPACWATEYSWASQRFIDPISALPARPTIVLRSERDTTLASSFIRWAYSSIYQNKTAYWGKLLGLMGVKYVIVRRDADLEPRDDLKQFNLENTLKILPNQGDLVLEKQLGSLLIYENPYCLPHISSAEGLSLVAGDRRTLITLSYLPSFDFGECPLAFLDNNIPLLELLPDVKSIIIEGDRYWDFMLSCVDESCIIRPWEHVKASINERVQWIRGDYSWYFYGGDLNVAPDNYVMTKGNNSIVLSFVAQKPDIYKVLVQVFETPRPDFKGIKCKVDDNGEVAIRNTMRCLDESFRWLTIGDYELNAGSHYINVTSLGGAAAISKIAVIPISSISVIERNLFKGLDGLNVSITHIFDDYSWVSESSSKLQISLNPNYSDGMAIRLTKGKIDADFYVFKSGNYVPLIRILNEEPEVSALKFSVDNSSEVFYVAPNSSASFQQLNPIMLERGHHSISLTTNENYSSFLVDSVILHRAGDSGDAECVCARAHSTSAPVNVQPPKSSINYTRRSGSLYEVYRGNAHMNFITFLEAYTENWQLEGEGWKKAPFILYGYANAFQIDGSELGNNFNLVYLGLVYVKQGFVISILLTVAIIAAIKVIREFVVYT
jgi:hypothetical protein